MRFLCRLFGHSWLTTHVNRWFMPTKQHCKRCEVVREWQGGPEFDGGGWK